jgi:hypothetical protein
MSTIGSLWGRGNNIAAGATVPIWRVRVIPAPTSGLIRSYDPWSVPVNLGDAMNTVNNKTRPSFSWAAQTLYFGRAGTGGIDRHLRHHPRETLGA